MKKNKFVKGTVKIQLFDEDKNLIHEEEKENMVTNAIYYALGQCITNNRNPIGSTAIFPLATKALGGLFVFDEELDEDEENIFFPMVQGEGQNEHVVHLIGHAGQDQNTSDPLRGSLNIAESGRTDTGYVNTWDFNTSQGNGTIKSVALTHIAGGSEPLCFTSNGSESDVELARYMSGNDLHIYRCRVFYYRNDIQTAFAFKDNKLVKFHAMSYNLKVTDPRYSTDSTEIQEIINPLIASVNDHNEVYDASIYSWTQDYNGNLYGIKINRISQRDKVDGQYYDRWHYNYTNEEGDATVWIRKWKYDDGTYVEDGQEQSYTLTNVRARKYQVSWNYPSAVINEGYLWLIHADNLHVYKIKLSDTAQISLYGPFNDEAVSGIYPMKGGGVITSRGILIYPDGNFVIKRYCRFGHFNYVDENLFMCGSTYTFDRNASNPNYPGNFSDHTDKLLSSNYLGTIMNLGSPITKTSANSMKIIYTLTDAEYEEEDEEE